jgi:hypothetical protein
VLLPASLLNTNGFAGGFPAPSSAAISEGVREIDQRMERRLRGLDAGSIEPEEGLDEAYQLVEIPRSHMATSLRMERRGEVVTLIARRHGEEDAYRRLSAEEWKSLRLALTAADVWSLLPVDAFAPRVLEAADDYLDAFWQDDARGLHRQSSDLGPPLTDVRRQLFALTGWGDPPVDPDATIR